VAAHPWIPALFELFGPLGREENGREQRNADGVPHSHRCAKPILGVKVAVNMTSLISPRQELSSQVRE